MNYLDRIFTQAEVSDITGLGQDLLRDWRRRGFLGQLGDQRRGRWFYNFHEIVVLSMVPALMPNGKGISDLVFMAHHLALSVINCARPDDDLQPFVYYENVAFWYSDINDGLIMAPFAISTLADWEKIPSSDPQLTIVNVPKLAESLPDGVKVILKLGSGEE